MSTLPYVSIPKRTWIDLYDETSIPIGVELHIQNIGSDNAILVESATQPPEKPLGFNIIDPREYQKNETGSVGLWAFSNNGTTLQIGNNGLKPLFGASSEDALPTTAFGELRSESKTPIAQISAEYGIFSDVLTVIDSGSSGVTSTIDSKYTCQTGAAADGLASILTFRQLKYRAGQGGLADFTAVFDTGVANSQQVAGLITAENSFVFGYLGAIFGIAHAKNGKAENQELTITTPAAGAETATVTIDGVGYPVSITAGTVQHNAFEIAEDLNAAVPNYTITSNDDQVVAQALISGAQGVFAFSSTGAAVAAWVQITAGLDPVVDFTPQTSWNIDTRISTNPDINLDPLAGNVFQIQFQYLGFGGIKFYVEDKSTGDLILVHVIKYANSNTVPSVSNPTFRVGWLVRNLGNATDLTLQGASAGMFVEGNIERAAQPLSDNNTQLAVGLLPTNIISFRNRASFLGKVNRIEVLPDLMTVATESPKAATFQLVLNPVFIGDLDWSYFDKANSITEVATDSVTLISGEVIGSVVVAPGSSFPIEFNEKNDQVVAFQPMATLAIVGNVNSGAAGDMSGSATWIEDV